VFSRRSFLICVSGIVVSIAFTVTASAQQSFEKEIKKLETQSGGRLGVAVLDTANGKQLGYRADERFAMCSTFKLLAVSAVLSKADRGAEQLDRVIRFTKEDLAAYSPVTKDHADGEGMSLKDLCEAAMTQSDNTAANLILASLGGPAGVTAFAHSIGDSKTRLDRNEPDLNQALPGDPRDTTTPLAMMLDLRKLAVGTTLSPSSLKLLTKWLIGNQTGDKRLRAGLPRNWRIGDKTGTGDRGTAGDVAIAWPAGRPPVLIAVYLTGSRKNRDFQDATIAQVGKVVADTLKL
jgi:beta-lactamase class A